MITLTTAINLRIPKKQEIYKPLNYAVNTPATQQFVCWSAVAARYAIDIPDEVRFTYRMAISTRQPSDLTIQTFHVETAVEDL